MGKSKGVIRANISLPRDLKKQMDETKVPVNWSAVAVEAFKTKLKELESEKETKSMDDVIARMKAAQELDDSEDHQEGMEAGENWARQEARPKELRRLVAYMTASQEYSAAHVVGMWENGMNKGSAWGLYEALTGRMDSDYSDMEAFWEGALGENWRDLLLEQMFAIGFIKGALETWNKVRNAL